MSRQVLLPAPAAPTRPTAMRLLLALLLCGCTASWQMGLGGPRSNPPPQYASAPAQAPPPGSTSEPTPTPPASPAVAAIEQEPPPPRSPPVDPALRKRARRIASHVETLLAKITLAFTSANGRCKRIAANLRAVTARTKKSRAEIQRALADAEKNAAFAAEWKRALDEISERTEPKLGALAADVRACESDPDVLVAIQPLRLRIFKKERAAPPD